MDFLLESLGSFFLSAEEARGQVEDGIECDKVTAHSRGSTGPDPREEMSSHFLRPVYGL